MPVDDRFETEEARQRDAAWQAFQGGFIAAPDQKVSRPFNAWKKPDIPLSDEYRFLIKYYHRAWVVFVFLFRIFTGHSPFGEWIALRKAHKSIRHRVCVGPIQHPQYEQFVSQLVESRPLVTVIIPTLNRYDHLRNALQDLVAQRYSNFEVIVVDQSDPYRAEFYQGWPINLRVWHQQERALWRARNEAIRAAKGKFFLLFDDDSRVGADWIEQHLKTLDFFQAEISSGVSLSRIGEKIPAHYSYFRWSDQLDTGNALIQRSVFEQIGLFDRQFEKQRMGDGEFGLRAYLAGFRNVSNPLASRLHMKVPEGGLREMGSWDSWRPRSWLAPRPVPSVLYLIRRYFGNRAALRYMIASAPQAILPYRWKGRQGKMLLLFPFAIVMTPVLFFQGWRAWREASKKLKEGPRIEKIT